jgi:hypothetical protein
MPDGVFHERLQDERRHGRVEGELPDVCLQAEAGAEPQRLNAR